MNQLSAAVISVLSQHLSTVLQALQAGKSTVQLHSQELQLSPDAACFAFIDSSVKVKANNPEKLLLFNSVLSTLPNDLLAHFRTVSMVKPDLRLTMEVQLLSQGV